MLTFGHKAARAQMLVISPSIAEERTGRTNGTVVDSWLMLDHHDLLRTHTRWQESSAGTAVSGDSIPINGNFSLVPNNDKAGWFRAGAEIKPAALAYDAGHFLKDFAQTTS